jgi:hypothetical protein
VKHFEGADEAPFRVTRGHLIGRAAEHPGRR